MINELSNDAVRIAVNSLGAELWSLKDQRSGTEHLWQGDPAFWKGRSPILFPVVGHLEDGVYRDEGREYTLDVHGFAKDREFRPVGETADTLTYLLESDEATLAVYPYRFALEVRYTLAPAGVRVEITARNRDDRAMYFSVGGHPGFNCPWEPGASMEDYRLVFERPETLRRRLHDVGILTGETEAFLTAERVVRLSHGLFERGAVMLGGLSSGSVALESALSAGRIRVELPGFPYLGIWSPRGEAPFVCIEPWHGIGPTRGADPEIRTREGILRLESEEAFTCGYAITIE